MGQISHNDLRLMNDTLAHEYLGMAAYEAAIRSGLLSDGVAAAARQFQRHHGEHAAKLREIILGGGGQPVSPKTHDAYAAELPLAGLKSEADVLALAAELEKGAASAYLDQVAEFNDPKLGRLMASISGDEAMHWAVLLYAQGLDPVPVAFVPGADAAH